MKFISRFLRLDKLYDINYTDQILRSIVKTTYAKKKFSTLLLMMLTVFVRLQIDALLGFIFNFRNQQINFIVQILISVILVLKSGWIYKIVERFDSEVYGLTRYLINNYSDENYRRWKRNITFTICIYLIIYLSFVEITSSLLIIFIIQYLICYVIIEFIERRYYNQVFGMFNKSPIFVLNDDDFEIKDIHLPSKKKHPESISDLSELAKENNVKIDRVDDNEVENETSQMEHSQSNIDDKQSNADDLMDLTSQCKVINPDPPDLKIKNQTTAINQNNTRIFISTDDFIFKSGKLKVL